MAISWRLGVAVLALAASVGAAAAEPSVKEIRIGVFPALRPLELVRQERWLEQAGYKVAWTDFLAGIPPEAAAMAAGSIDFGEADSSGIVQVAARSPGVMWYIANGAQNYVSLVARRDSGIRTVADLKGKKVGGVAPNTAPTAVLQMALAKVGLTLRDLQGYNIVGPSQPAALERGAIDAAISYVPHAAETIVAGTSVLITTADEVYGKPWLGGGVIVRPDFARAHKDVVLDVLRMVDRAEKMMREQPEAAWKSLAVVSHSNAESVAYSYRNNLVATAPVIPDKAVMAEQARVLAEYHVITVPDIKTFLDELVHPEFAVEALSR
jgi:ABC-type nitrate/sulfonate/bicarbonate transport system substrate-binding protein